MTGSRTCDGRAEVWWIDWSMAVLARLEGVELVVSGYRGASSAAAKGSAAQSRPTLLAAALQGEG